MPAATILFTDTVAFSKQPSAVQLRLIEGLTSEVVHELRVLLNPPFDAPGVLAMPTGDGIALAFLHKPDQRWDRSSLVRLALRLHRWAHTQSGANGPVALRIGIHVGAVHLVTDINGRPNVSGDTVNFAQRVMDAADPRQTLFSEAAFREYFGSDSAASGTPLSVGDLKATVHGAIQVHAKHNLQILVYRLALEPVQDCWSNEDPLAKDLVVVSLTPLPKEIVGSFSERLKAATEIAFVQLTGDRFLRSFGEGKIILSAELRRFWVFMPHPEAYGRLLPSSSRASTEYVVKCVAQWREFFATIKARYPTADMKLGLFKEPPYYGASFMDWERPGGRIHISPYVWNVPAPRCPGYDLQWLGTAPPPVYEVYVEALRYLNSQTSNDAS